MIIPIPKWIDEPEQIVQSEVRGPSAETVRQIFDVPGWKCPACNATMGNGQTYCVYCKIRLGRYTPKP